MGKKERPQQQRGGSSSTSWAQLGAGLTATVAVLLAVQQAGKPGGSAAAEFTAFKEAMTRDAQSLSFGAEAVGRLEACLAIDPAHSQCGYFLGKHLLQLGGAGNRRALELFSGLGRDIARPEFEMGPSQVESLFFLATAAEKSGDREQLEAANRQIIAATDRRPTGFRGVPNVTTSPISATIRVTGMYLTDCLCSQAWAGLASMYAQRGEPEQSLAAVESGIKAAAKLRPRHTDRPTDEMSKRHVVVLSSALPELIAVKGLATAALAAGGPQEAVDAAQEIYRSAVQTEFKPWPRPDQGKAAQHFGLNLAALRMKVEPAAPSPEPPVDEAADTGTKHDDFVLTRISFILTK